MAGRAGVEGALHESRRRRVPVAADAVLLDADSRDPCRPGEDGRCGRSATYSDPSGRTWRRRRPIAPRVRGALQAETRGCAEDLGEDGRGRRLEEDGDRAGTGIVCLTSKEKTRAATKVSVSPTV